MLFGFFNALVTFQKYFNKIFAEKFNIFVILYLNIILIYTKNSGQSYVYLLFNQIIKSNFA